MDGSKLGGVWGNALGQFYMTTPFKLPEFALMDIIHNSDKTKYALKSPANTGGYKTFFHIQEDILRQNEWMETLWLAWINLV